MSTNSAFDAGEILRDFGLNLAASYAEKLLTAGYVRAYNFVRGSPQQRALRAVYAAAFTAFLGELAKGRQRLEVAALSEECRCFFNLPDVSEAMLAVALDGQSPDVARLEARFVESGAAERLVNIRVDLRRGLDVYVAALTLELLTRAGEKDSDLSNLVLVHRIVELQRQVGHLGEHLQRSIDPSVSYISRDSKENLAASSRFQIFDTWRHWKSFHAAAQLLHRELRAASAQVQRCLDETPEGPSFSKHVYNLANLWERCHNTVLKTNQMVDSSECLKSQPTVLYVVAFKPRMEYVAHILREDELRNDDIQYIFDEANNMLNDADLALHIADEQMRAAFDLIDSRFNS